MKILSTLNKVLTVENVKSAAALPLYGVAKLVDTLIDFSVKVLKNIRKDFVGVGSIIATALCLVLVASVCVTVETTVPVFRGATKSEAEMFVYTNCHKMSNNFIVAEDGKVRGFVDAGDKNIDRILSVLAQYDIEEKDTIIDILSEFKRGDYRGALWLHNHCWEHLNGEKGYAIDLKPRYKDIT